MGWSGGATGSGTPMSFRVRERLTRGKRRKENGMGLPVVHFEVIGKDGARLQEYYSELFGWSIDADNELGYGTIARNENLAPDGSGIGGGIAGGPPGYEGHVTFYVAVPDVEEALA
jgi:predicted enzyme related to lactoylglutathione lyase